MAKAYPNDSARGIARLDPNALLTLRLSPGDIIEIEGMDLPGNPSLRPSKRGSFHRCPLFQHSHVYHLPGSGQHLSGGILQASGHGGRNFGVVLPGSVRGCAQRCAHPIKIRKAQDVMGANRRPMPPRHSRSGKLDIRVDYRKGRNWARGLVRIRRQPPKL